MAEGLKRPIHLAPGKGVTVTNPVGGPLTFKVRGEDTDGALAAFESVAAPGEGPPLHLHVDADEIWYALDGAFRFRLEDSIRDAPAGAFVFIPRGVTHTWQNVGTEPARFLAVLVPAGLERFFDRFAALPAGSSPREAFNELGAQVGMKVVGPSLAESDPL